MDERKPFKVTCMLTAEEMVLFDNIRAFNGLSTSALTRAYIKEGMARDSIHVVPKVVANTPTWTDNVQPFGRYRHSN